MRILIADDHALFRDGMKSLLRSRSHSVVGEARDGREAVDLARRLVPDVVLMDLSLPVLDGLSATRLICAQLPQVKVVVVTVSDDDEDLFEAVKAGAQGFLTKDVRADQFFTLLDGLAENQPALTPASTHKLLLELHRPRRPSRSDDPDELTEHELGLLDLMVGGVTTNRLLASTLRLSENTIKFHVQNILKKLHQGSRAQAIAYVLREGIVRGARPLGRQP